MVSTMTNTPAPIRLLTERKVAELLALSESYLRKIRSGVCTPPAGFPASRKIGRAVRYTLGDVESFIAGPATEVTQ